MSTPTAPSQSRDTNTAWPARPYRPRHTSWPFTPADFARQDESEDTDFYSSPRFVTHIDDHAINQLRAYYASVLPRTGRILDFCSSWISHYPPEVENAVTDQAVEVVGMGMNKAELDKNPVLAAKDSRILVDLNQNPDVGKAVGDGKFDAATCVVSIDYLTQPREVLSSLRSCMNEGGTVHLIISNRCFPTKAVGQWLRISEEERLQMVAEYLHFSGWSNVEIVDLLNRDASSDVAAEGLSGLMKWVGRGGHDPLWVVRGRNAGVDATGAA